MTQPTPKTWYVTAARALPNWGTAVVSGKATIDLFKIEDTPGTLNDKRTKWKETGQAVSAAEVAMATQSNTDAGALPAAHTPQNTGSNTVQLAQIGKRAATPNATDLATAITLANALKADLIALGLKRA